MNAVGPSLDDLAAHPERARDLAPAVAADLLARVAGLQPVQLSRALASAGGASTASEAPDPRLLTIREVAVRLGVAPAYAYELARRGDLPVVRVGRRYVRVSAATLAAWIERQGLDSGSLPMVWSPHGPRRGSATPRVARPDASPDRRAARRHDGRGVAVGEGREARKPATHTRAGGAAPAAAGRAPDLDGRGDGAGSGTDRTT